MVAGDAGVVAEGVVCARIIDSRAQPRVSLFYQQRADPDAAVGDNARIRAHQQLAVEAYSRDNNTRIESGRLLTIDNQIDQTTGTIKLKAHFDNQDLSLWPNQFVNVRLFLSVRKNAIVIPSAAIQKGSQGSFVYAVGSDNKAAVRPVQVEFSEGNDSVIREGVAEGDQIVVDGQDKLQSGAAVSVHAAGSSRAPAANPTSELQP